jgi:glycogen operon protein
MILMGDEVRRTQGGNNNAYCHDDETTWFDWTLLEKHADVHRFMQLLAERRVLRDVSAERQRIPLVDVLLQANKAWHGVSLWRPDWGPNSHSLALGADVRRAGLTVHLIMNAYWDALDFELPLPEGNQAWRRWIDTSLDTPNDITPWQHAPGYTGRQYHAAARSVVVLWKPLTTNT